MRNLVLVGMPGCGKSTIGVLTAKALQMDFVDTDILLQKQTGKPLQQLVNELGVAGFSNVEERCVCDLITNNAVIATGGSVALEEAAIKHLAQNGLVVFVRLPYEEICKRLHNIRTRGVVMQKGQTLQELYDYRQPYYERCADRLLDADGLSIEETVEKLVAIVRDA